MEKKRREGTVLLNTLHRNAPTHIFCWNAQYIIVEKNQSIRRDCSIVRGYLLLDRS